MRDNRVLMWRNKVSAAPALPPPETCVRAYDPLASAPGLEPIAPSEVMSASGTGTWQATTSSRRALGRVRHAAAAGIPRRAPFHLSRRHRDAARRGPCDRAPHRHPSGLLPAQREGVRAQILGPARRLCHDFGCDAVHCPSVRAALFARPCAPARRIRPYLQGVSAAAGFPRAGSSTCGWNAHRSRQTCVSRSMARRFSASLRRT